MDDTSSRIDEILTGILQMYDFEFDDKYFVYVLEN